MRILTRTMGDAKQRTDPSESGAEAVAKTDDLNFGAFGNHATLNL